MVSTGSLSNVGVQSDERQEEGESSESIPHSLASGVTDLTAHLGLGKEDPVVRACWA